MSKTPLQVFLSNKWNVLILLIGQSFLIRFFSFFQSVIDHDESTYILIADAIRHGQIYLRDVFDTKPIGIFALFALFQNLFGHSIEVIRIMTTIWVALTAWVLFLAHRQLLGKPASEAFNPAPVSSAFIYVVMISTYTFYGISPNTELFFNLFTIASLLIMLRFQHIVWFFISGLLLGIGYMIKYVVLFDAVALGLFYIWLQVRAGKSWWYWFSRCAVMGIGFLLPLSLIWEYYIRLGLGDTFWFYSFELSGRYFIDAPFSEYVLFILQFFLRFLPISVWYFFCLWYWRKPDPVIPVFGAFWSIMVFIIILLPGKLFGHYFIQLMLPVCLVAGSFYDNRRLPGKAFAWMKKPAIGYPLLLGVIIVNLAFQKKDYWNKKDQIREIAEYLNTRLEPGDKIYTGNYHPIIYLLTKTQSPTPYIHRSLLWSSENREALKLNEEEEFNKILRQNPRFIILEKKGTVNNTLKAALQSSYTPVKTFIDKITVYERR